jgi:hypothetical protein
LRLYVDIDRAAFFERHLQRMRRAAVDGSDAGIGAKPLRADRDRIGAGLDIRQHEAAVVARMGLRERMAVGVLEGDSGVFDRMPLGIGDGAFHRSACGGGEDMQGNRLRKQQQCGTRNECVMFHLFVVRVGNPLVAPGYFAPHYGGV